MRKLTSILCIFLLLVSVLGSCTGKQPFEDDIQGKGKALQEQSQSRIVQVIKEPYLGASAINLPLNEQHSGIMESRVTLRTKGTLSQICRSIETMLPLKVLVEAAPVRTAGEKTQEPAAGGSDLAALLNNPPLTREQKADRPSERLAISFEGKLHGLLDFIASFYGLGWHYDAPAATVTFSAEQVKTFTILAAPGKISYDNRITNKSRDSLITAGTNSRVNMPSGNSSDSQSQTAQTNETKFETDIWSEIEKGIKGLLSKNGTVTPNQAAGTVTVRDNAPVLRQVSRLVEDWNAKLQRQVAISVKAWALEVSTESDIGIDIKAMFQNSNIALAGAGVLPAATAGAGELTATILDGKYGKWKGSTAMLQAMREHGKATLLTAGSGVTMNNQPMPVQNVNKEAYLAAVGSTQTEYGRTTEITPGEVTVGFAMTVVPHILDRRRVILQYNINLSSLDGMRTFSTGDSTVELPKVSTRSFSQRASMKMGQTLVLAGFEQERHGASNTLGILGGGRSSKYGKTLIVITIDVESLTEA